MLKALWGAITRGRGPVEEPDHGWVRVEVKQTAIITHEICANPDHPNGAWHGRHPAWGRERRENIRAHGCACYTWSPKMLSGGSGPVPTHIDGATVVERYDPNEATT